jgi:hypothetical protein
LVAVHGSVVVALDVVTQAWLATQYQVSRRFAVHLSNSTTRMLRLSLSTYPIDSRFKVLEVVSHHSPLLAQANAYTAIDPLCEGNILSHIHILLYPFVEHPTQVSNFVLFKHSI